MNKPPKAEATSSANIRWWLKDLWWKTSPGGKSQRKALAEINGKIVVVMSQERLTFHDFSEALVEIGAKNAIYLVGSTAYGHYHIGNKTVPFGKRIEHPMSQTNYLVWR